MVLCPLKIWHGSVPHVEKMGQVHVFRPENRPGKLLNSADSAAKWCQKYRRDLRLAWSLKYGFISPSPPLVFFTVVKSTKVGLDFRL